MQVKDSHEAPRDVQYIRMMASIGQPIGITFYKEALEKYPEYFQEEIAYNQRWEEIPREVKDAYHNELYNCGGKEITPAMGLFELMEEAETRVIKPLAFEDIPATLESMWESRQRQESQEKERKQRKKELFDKYFSKYGLKYEE